MAVENDILENFRVIRGLNFEIGNSSAFNPQINFWHVSEFWRTREWKFLARLDTVSRSRKRSKTDFFREIFIESNFLALGLRALRIVHSKCSTSVKTSCGRVEISVVKHFYFFWRVSQLQAMTNTQKASDSIFSRSRSLESANNQILAAERNWQRIECVQRF